MSEEKKTEDTSHDNKEASTPKGEDASKSSQPNKPTAEGADAAQAGAGAAPISFVVIDSNEAEKSNWDALIQEGFPGSTAVYYKTGFEVISILKDLKAQFFICSWELIGMSGMILMQKIKNISAYQTIPFLIVSEILKEEDINLAKEFGIENYILKPFKKEDAINKIKNMLKQDDPNDPVMKAYTEAIGLYAKDNYSAAVKALEPALKAEGPMQLKVYTLQGLSLIQIDINKAEDSLKAALAIDGNYFDALNGLGKLYFKTKRMKDAIATYEILNKSSPNNLNRLIELGEAYLHENDVKNAKTSFTKVGHLEPENKDAKQGLGKVAFVEGQLDAAQKFFKESGKGEELAAYYNNQGIFLVSQNKYKEAVILYKNALAVLPSVDKTHLLEYNIGLAYKKNGDFHKASDSFARSYLLQQNFKKAYSALAATVKLAAEKNQMFDTNLVEQAVKNYKNSMSKEKD